jgi:anthranilate phosphoribosyltransferase
MTTTGEALKPFLAQLASGEKFSPAQAGAAFDAIMGGHATPAQIGAFLMGLRVRGETIEEITAAASVMRERMIAVTAPNGCIDIVGTGGDGSGSYNISTSAAIVVAACGVKVAKHGNRALSSKSGAGDILSVLGVNLGQSPEGITRCINEAGIGFMFAPNHHPAIANVGPARKELGTRTIFNMLGPLCNPASVKHALMGVYDASLVEPVAHVLKNLGFERALVVHGRDGMDELTLTTSTLVAELKNGAVSSYEITPQDAGFETVPMSALQGGTPEENAAAFKKLLAGEPSAYRNIVLFNASAALMVAGKADNLKSGVRLAANAIDTGAACKTLEQLVAVSNGGSQ